MANIKYLITLPESKDIMVAQSGETAGEYKITDINLESESIIGKAITDATNQDMKMDKTFTTPMCSTSRDPSGQKTAQRKLLT